MRQLGLSGSCQGSAWLRGRDWSEEVIAVVRAEYGRPDSMETELKNTAVGLNSISQKNQYRNKGSQLLGGFHLGRQ